MQYCNIEQRMLHLIYVSFLLTHILFPLIYSCTFPIFHILMFQKEPAGPISIFQCDKLKSKILSRKTKENNAPFGFPTFQGHEVASCADIIAKSSTGCRIFASQSQSICWPIVHFSIRQDQKATAFLVSS